MHAFELDVMHKPPLVLGASLNPSSTVAKGAADRVRLSTSFCNHLGEPSKTTLNFNDAGFAPPDFP